MTYNVITADYAAAPMIAPEDIAAIKEAGYTTVLCNRPDMEVPAPLQAAAMRAAVEAAGLTFVANPFTNGMLTQDVLDLQEATLKDAPGPVLAYCASGTRSTILWLMVQAKGGADIDACLAAAERAGYQLGGMRPQLQALADQG